MKETSKEDKSILVYSRIFILACVILSFIMVLDKLLPLKIEKEPIQNLKLDYFYGKGSRADIIGSEYSVVTPSFTFVLPENLTNFKEGDFLKFKTSSIFHEVVQLQFENVWHPIPHTLHFIWFSYFTLFFVALSSFFVTIRFYNRIEIVLTSDILCFFNLFIVLLLFILD